MHFRIRWCRRFPISVVVRVRQNETFERFKGRHHLIQNGGWHFTFLGGSERIGEKVRSYAHGGGHYDDMLRPGAINEQLTAGYQLGRHDITEFMQIDESFPVYVRDNLKQLTEKGFIKPALTRVRELERLYRETTRQRARIQQREEAPKAGAGALENVKTSPCDSTAPCAQASRKIHLGCGANILAGWTNTDLHPRSAEIMRLDLTATFPFDDNSFDFAYSEHVIEHLDFQGGSKMLSETYRILKPGGRLRISTPDLRQLVKLLIFPDEPLHARYIRWAVEFFVPYATSPKPAFAFNNFFRGFSHYFIYDRETLTELLNLIGFAQLESFAIRVSNHPELKNLERQDRMPDGFLQLETMSIEAVKPPS